MLANAPWQFLLCCCPPPILIQSVPLTVETDCPCKVDEYDKWVPRRCRFVIDWGNWPWLFPATIPYSTVLQGTKTGLKQGEMRVRSILATCLSERIKKYPGMDGKQAPHTHPILFSLYCWWRGPTWWRQWKPCKTFFCRGYYVPPLFTFHFFASHFVFGCAWFFFKRRIFPPSHFNSL